MQCDYNGKITYPSTGATNIFDALDKIEAKHNARYVTEREKGHQHQLKPLPTTRSIYQAREHKRLLGKIENLCIAKAYISFDNWKDRVKYLKAAGYEYKHKNSKVTHEKLQCRIKALVESGEWEELVKEVKGH